MYKGFVYRFTNVRVRENMAGKVNRYPDSVVDRFRNRYFIIDFETIMKENKRRYVEKHTESCKYRTALVHAQKLATVIFFFFLPRVEIYLRH